MNVVCHYKECSDVAIHLEFQLDCRARQAGLAMTNPTNSLVGARSASWLSSWIAQFSAEAEYSH
jgi:hypothetical protein